MNTKRGGKRAGAGRPANPPVPEVKDKNAAAKLINAINGPRPHGKVKVKPDESGEKKDPEDCKCEVCAWWDLANAGDMRIRLDTRKFLYDKRDGKAVNTVNHLHDKPIDLNVNVSMSELVRRVRQRKQEYERKRN